jgi:hypothetical protein
MSFRVAPILPNNLDVRKKLAIQESDAANHAIRKEMVGPNGLEPNCSFQFLHFLLRRRHLKPKAVSQIAVRDSRCNGLSVN